MGIIALLQWWSMAETWRLEEAGGMARGKRSVLGSPEEQT